MVLALLMDLGRDRPPSAATREAEDEDAEGFLCQQSPVLVLSALSLLNCRHITRQNECGGIQSAKISCNKLHFYILAQANNDLHKILAMYLILVQILHTILSKHHMYTVLLLS